MPRLKAIITIIIVFSLISGLASVISAEYTLFGTSNIARAELPISDFDSSTTARAILDQNKLSMLSEGEGEFASGDFGTAVSNPADFNGDGFTDIAVGAPFASPQSKSNAGAVYIYYGSVDIAIRDLDATAADVTIFGNVPFELFGSALCVPGDINGDNMDDILIGAPEADSYSGKVYGFFSSTINSGNSHQSDGADIVIQKSVTGEKFGFSMKAIGDVNADSEPDIIIGAPGADRAYIGYGPTYGSSARTALVGPSGSDFGTSVSGGTDINSDGYPDYIVGAPVGIQSSNNKGQVFIYLGTEDFTDNKNVYVENNTLLGFSDGDLFGQSVTSSIDIDNDGLYDIVVGSPGDDSVYIYYGKTIIDRYLYPYLWNMPGDRRQPVDFSSGVYNDVGTNLDVNTYGLGSGDDGWDWSPNVFGSSSGGDMDHIYGAEEKSTPPYADAEGLTAGNTSRIEVIVGRTNTGPGPTLGWFTTGQDSGAWGIEFSISSGLYDHISNGAEIFLELDWEAHDTLKYFGLGGGTEELCYVKMRFNSASQSTYMGTNLGGDTNPELFFWESGSGMSAPFPSVKEHFSEEISTMVESAGSYYLEMGARLEKTDIFATKDGNEGIVAFFDNISVYVKTTPIPYSVKLSGVSQSQFGAGISDLSDMNGDGYPELALGAPYSNLGGLNAGSIFIFYGGPALSKQINSNEAERIINGVIEDENFGAVIFDSGNQNGDEYNEIIIGAPGYSSGVGKIYVMTPAQAPEIEILKPKGGMKVGGEIALLANVSDFEDKVDIFGVDFYYGENTAGSIEWILISNILIPDTRSTSGARSGRADRFSLNWDTNEVPDGFYQVKAVVTDNIYLSSEDLTVLFEIDNPDSPIIKILSPVSDGETFTGILTLKANCTDPDLDLNHTSFYYSQDDISWEYIGRDFEGQDNEYQHDWDTEDLADGDYRIKVVANDTSGLHSEELSVQFKIYNPGPPTINFIRPAINDTLIGYSELSVSVKDKDENIGPGGVTFYFSRDRNTWTIINTVTTDNADRSWSTFWNTIKVSDGYYWLRAYVEDATNLSAETLVGPVLIDNPSPPSIKLDPVDSPVSGRTGLRAVCFDDDSPLSTEGVSFYVSTDRINWSLLGSSRTPLLGGSLSNFNIEWDTINDELPDSTGYYLKATVKDATGLSNETTFGPFEVNNPDPPTVRMDYPTEGASISGTVIVGAYAEDPDGDIDSRGISFYFSSDGKEWHLIDSSSPSSENDELYQAEWDTTRLPDGKYRIKAEVVDSDALRSETVVIAKINNGGDDGFLNVSSTFMYGAIIFLIIIIILSIFLLSLYLKRRKIKEEQKKVDERKELATQIRQEIMSEQLRMYPSLTESPKSMPVLPPYSHAASPYGAAAESSGAAGERPMLPAYSGPEDGTAEGNTGPYTQASSGERALTTEEQSYQPKVGLTPDEIAVLKVDGTVNAPTQIPQAQPKPAPQSMPHPQSVQRTTPVPVQTDGKPPHKKMQDDGTVGGDE
jgi:hypothetical protein